MYYLFVNSVLLCFILLDVDDTSTISRSRLACAHCFAQVPTNWESLTLALASNLTPVGQHHFLVCQVGLLHLSFDHHLFFVDKRL